MAPDTQSINIQELVALTDEALREKLQTADGWAEHFSSLLGEVYGDDTLSDEREALLTGTQTLTPPLAEAKLPSLDSVTDQRLQYILRVRIALMRAYPNQEPKDWVRELILAAKDGDLAHNTLRHQGGTADVTLILGSADHMDQVPTLRFSPELQRIIARTPNTWGNIPVDLAQNHYLTVEAQRLLLGHGDRMVRASLKGNPHAVWRHDKDKSSSGI